MITENQELFVHWVLERDLIRRRKEKGEPKPWTQDKVMQTTYFCNVNREDDRVTRWIRENWRYEFGPEFYDFAMIAARLFNQPNTLEIIGQPTEDIERWLHDTHYTLRKMQDNKERVFNGAYIVSTNGRKMNKIDYVLELLKQFTTPYLLHKYDRLDMTHKFLATFQGMGSFMAAQVIADLKNTKGHPLQQADDWWTFSSFGPGSLRGLSWFWESKITPATYQGAIARQYAIAQDHLPQSILQTLCMQNLQNCNCEYDKYMRVLNGTGRSKRQYQGAA